MEIIYTRNGSSADLGKKEVRGGPAVSPDSDQSSMAAAFLLFFSGTQRMHSWCSNTSTRS